VRSLRPNRATIRVPRAVRRACCGMRTMRRAVRSDAPREKSCQTIAARRAPQPAIPVHSEWSFRRSGAFRIWAACRRPPSCGLAPGCLRAPRAVRAAVGRSDCEVAPRRAAAPPFMRPRSQSGRSRPHIGRPCRHVSVRLQDKGPRARHARMAARRGTFPRDLHVQNTGLLLALSLHGA
jgi:hypothetical protein